MSTEVNKDLSRRWHEEVINHRKVDSIDQFFHPNYIDHRGNVQGFAAAKAGLLELVKDFPDLHVRIEDLIAERDKVVTRWSWLQGGRVTRTGISIWQIVDGKIAEDWYHSTAAPEA